MDSVSHLTNVVMEIKTALMAVMNWTAVSMIKAWEHLHVSHEWRLVDIGGRCPTTNLCVINHSVSFLLVKLSTVDFVNVWCPGCCWSTRWWNLVRYLNVDPPPYVHLAFTVRHSHHGYSQAFPIFHTLLLPCIILNANQRTKTVVAWEWSYYGCMLNTEFTQGTHL